MPEGDTIHRAAETLRPALERATVVGLFGSHRAVAPHRSRLIGQRIESVAAHGKHLLIHLDHGWTVRTHMAMTGHWRVYRPGEPWRTTPGKARLVIETKDAVAVCFAAPYVEIGPTEKVMQGLERIGPDLVEDAVPYAAVVARASRHPGPTMADLLLDQSVASGIGNVFKSELLFLEGLSPHDPPWAVSPQDLDRIYRRASRLLASNVSRGPRSTTGSRRRNEETWVYGRAGKPCRRCGSIVQMERHGDLDRTTYWCPGCQPPAGSGRPSRSNESKG